MSKERIAKLESLLDRVRKNAAAPRRAASVAAEVSVATEAAVEPVEEEAIEELDLGDDIVELSSDEPAAPVGLDVELELDEPAPASAPRATEAVASAEPEARPKTLPPESGRQEVLPDAAIGTEAELSGAEDVDALLETDLSDRPISMPPAHGGPTMEQLGDTVDIEGGEAAAAELELGHPASEAPPSPEAAHELEAPLPAREFSGGYEAGLAPPPHAQADLERHDRSASKQAPPSLLAEEPPPVSAAGRAPSGPEVTERPAVPSGVSPARFSSVEREAEPTTFLGLLDRSLGLKA